MIAASGCDLSPGRLTVGTTGSTVGKLYVSNPVSKSILRFDSALNATGNVAPGATISGPATLLTNPQYLQVDTIANRLFVADAGQAAILIFESASTRTGNVAPDRTIAGASTTLAAPFDLALDPGRDLLYVADGSRILAFASSSTVNGNVVPVRTISPQFAGTSFVMGAILLDAANDRLFIADETNNAIQVFDTASLLNGTFAPSRTIIGAATQVVQPRGLLLDSTGRLIVSNFGTPSITVYAAAATATGNVVPAAAITGTATTLNGPSQITLDPGTGDLYVADGFAGAVSVFSNMATATGNIAPTRQIAGAVTALARAGAAGAPTATGIALDPTR